MNPETLATLRRVSTATLTTQMFKRGFRNVFLQGVRGLASYGANMVGPATTVRNIPAREDLDVMASLANPEHPQRKAVETCKPGHVLVMDCRGDARVASGGDILMTRLLRRGAAGVVTDGGIRDAGPIGRMALPVFCAGPSAPLNIVQHHAVEIDTPIACGGVAVYPGDIMVGDSDGVVVLPAHLADEVAKDAAAQESLEEFILTRIDAGAPLPGTYPPNAATLAEYEAWKKAKA
ncbi:MAG: ribonuclease activity regulator RraA [Acetobacteraceae bacterium]|nr:ribonuclease activity regulator RraA [Acetobacteraceae bacterium]